MGTRSKGLFCGMHRQRNPLTATGTIYIWRNFWQPGFPRPPKRQFLKSGKRFKHCRKGKP